MGDLDNMLNNQQTQGVSTSNEKSLLKKLSSAYMWIGCIEFILGIIAFFAGISDNKEELLTVGICIFFGGLFTTFAGCIGEAIDDIRNSVKK